MPLPNLPTDSELEILRVLWEREPCAVRDVHEQFVHEGRSVAYTTVLKLLQIMTEKGLVRRDVSSRAHLYRAAIPRPQTQKQLVDDLVQRAFGGAASELVLTRWPVANLLPLNWMRSVDCSISSNSPPAIAAKKSDRAGYPMRTPMTSPPHQAPSVFRCLMPPTRNSLRPKSP